MIPPRQTHLMEQFQAMMRDLGSSLGAYREELLKAGFTEAQAYEMVRKIEGEIVGGAMADAEERLADERGKRGTLTNDPEVP